jgi:Tfp pilus assembly protein PilN
MRAFNLLNYPALAVQRRKRHRWWTSLAGLALGSALAWWGAQLVQETAEQVQQERRRLQGQLIHEQARWRDLQTKQEALKIRLLQTAHLAQIDYQNTVWEALYRTLQSELGPGSAQLMRLQLEAKQLEMHGIASDAQRMDQVRHALSLQLAQHLQPAFVLSSWVMTPSAANSAALPGVRAQSASGPTRPKPSEGGSLEFVWHSGWPDGLKPSERGNAAKTAAPTAAGSS